jgi:hypothetical protein
MVDVDHIGAVRLPLAAPDLVLRRAVALASRLTLGKVAGLRLCQTGRRPARRPGALAQPRADQPPTRRQTVRTSPTRGMVAVTMPVLLWCRGHCTPAVPQQGHEPEAASDGDDVAGPDDPGRERRLAWADLLRRVFSQDVLVCSRCGGPMRPIAVVTDPPVAEKIVRHRRLCDRGPPGELHVVLNPAPVAFA